MIQFKSKKKELEELDKKNIQILMWFYIKYWKIIATRYDRCLGRTEKIARDSIERLRNSWKILLKKVEYRWYKKAGSKSYASSKINIYDLWDIEKIAIDEYKKNKIKDYNTKIIKANKEANIEKILTSQWIKINKKKKTIQEIEDYNGGTPYNVTSVTYDKKTNTITEWTNKITYNLFNYIKIKCNKSYKELNLIFNIS